MRVFSAALALMLAIGVAAGSVACKKPEQHFQTAVEVVKIRAVASAQEGRGPPGAMDLELRYVDCPGDARNVMRGDKAFAACGHKFKKGDKLEAEVVRTYNSARSSFRAELVRLGDCPVKIDPDDESNYEIVQVCSDLKASGNTVGVHCDRKRAGELVAKCPWLAR